MLIPTTVLTQASGVQYGTSLPDPPVDGQEAILVDSTTAPTYTWRFRYNAGSASAYKWEFIGGAPKVAYVAANETTTTTSSWLNLATTGPDVLIPRAGEYVCGASSSALHSIAGADLYIGVAANNGSPSQSSSLTTPAANYIGDLVIAGFLMTFAASDNARLRYLVGVAGTAHWLNRMLTVIPVRVS